MRDIQKHKAAQKRWYEQVCKGRRAAWFLANGPCKHCGSWNRLELHHVDPATKICHAVWSWSDAKREAELEKCEPLCNECHKEVSAAYTAELQRRPITHGIQAGYRRGCKCPECSACYREARRRKYELHGI